MAANVTGATPATVAVAVLAPLAAPSVQLTVASPAAFVSEVEEATDPPPAVTTHVTEAPLTPFAN